MTENVRDAPSRPFDEIHLAQVAFELFELESAQIGSGRPSGPRSHLWGSIVILARASLEDALRRLHRELCGVPECRYTRPQLDPTKFLGFLRYHDVTPAEGIPESLHVALLLKDVAKSGSGTGKWVNGVRDQEQLVALMAGLNHIRNGFAHRDPRKTEMLPPGGSGILWVAPEEGSEWTVQKPHAVSAMRFCEVVFRYVVQSVWGEQIAVQVRSPLPVLLSERVRQQGRTETAAGLGNQLSLYLESGRRGDALVASRSIPRLILTEHYLGDLPEQALPLDWSDSNEGVVSLFDRWQYDEPAAGVEPSTATSLWRLK